MHTESQLDRPKGMSPRAAMYITLQLAWAYYIGYKECPSKLYLSSWLNRTGDDWSIIVDAIKAAGEREVDNPQNWVWSQLRRKFPQQQRWVVTTPATA